LVPALLIQCLSDLFPFMINFKFIYDVVFLGLINVAFCFHQMKLGIFVIFCVQPIFWTNVQYCSRANSCRFDPKEARWISDWKLTCI
jgi:hypothetical protein